MDRFRINTPGVKAIRTSPEARTYALGQARVVAAEAKRLAPVRTGHYRKSIAPTVYFGDGGWIGRVNAFDFKAIWVELGTNGIRKSRVLGTALDAASTTVRLGGGR